MFTIQSKAQKTHFFSIFLFAVIIFVISFADGIMSFISPIFIEEQVHSTFLMGIVFAFSSVVGIACDLFFPKVLTNKPHFFFLKATILTALAFPLAFLFFPQHLATLLLAMAIWGIYYELNVFSSFQFVHTYVHLNEHTKTWGIIQSAQSSAYALAPLLAAELLVFGYSSVFTAVITFIGLAMLLAIIFNFLFVRKKISRKTTIIHTKSWTTEIHVWRVLFKKTWPLLFLQLLVTTIDGTFWTIGTLFMQELSNQHVLGNMFLTVYVAPSAIVGLLLGKIPNPFGKKKTALLSSGIAGLGLFSYTFIQNVPLLLLITFFSATFLAIAIPELKATFEDYVSRLRESDTEMIGMQGSSASLAYVIGPILATFLASATSIKTAFSIIGFLVFIISLYLSSVIPKKISMPQKELAQIDSQ